MTDYNKSLWYIILDLVIKAGSSAALIILGYAGWQLQSSNQAQQDLIRNQDIRARTFLPPLQTLTQLQITLAVGSGQLGLNDSGPANIAANIGWQLRYLLDSLQAPKVSNAEISLSSLRAYYNIEEPRLGLRMPYRQAVNLAADFAELLPQIRRICTSPGSLNFVGFQKQIPAIYFSLEKANALPGDRFFVVDANFVPGWEMWFPSDPLGLSTFCEIDFGQLFREIARASSNITVMVLSEYPDLAERSVSLRMESLKLKNDLFESQGSK